ncbi:putative UDP-glucoronosyl and UDP-glucosyl transferase [Lyophyllum shimeji]|uniref:UDP-glucoronosyl and UDP-glucosyl transferase n=1 Tax=Lyophyllum shimeji TaxID=47721 RepID=A0A9P3PNC4_LYOSH|nr:putative UDP-glucoronosyl and UDP-glucosyl transferase [Lyophyllum shimeji]
MTSSPMSHVLMVSIPAWGHLRPLCVLAARLVSERDNVLITFLTPPNMFQKSRSEIDRQFGSGSPAIKRIRLLSISQFTDPKDLMAVFGLLVQAYPGAYETLAQGKSITCSTTGTSFDPAPAPVVVILDFFLLESLKATRALSGRSVPIISWITGSASSFIRFWGPESRGGMGDLPGKIDAEVARTNKSPVEVGEKLLKHANGSVVKLPGLPPMYDYEFHPQKLAFEIPMSMILIAAHEFLADSDGIMIASADAYERESLDAVRAWFGEMQKPVYVVGPLLPAGYAAQSDVNEWNANIADFLSNMLEKHGRRSVLFISFGTVFWPATPEYVEELIEALLEKNVPFILAHASPFARISAELSDKVKASGLGMLTPWSPQQFILNHPATGWFLTHGGHGGVTESLGSGIPLICWPFDADQPAAAAHVSQNLKAGFELIEVRTGLGLNPVYRLGGEVPKGNREAVGAEIRRVLDACRGPEGEELRRNAERLKGEFAAAWEEGGPAKATLRGFLEKYV